MPWWRSHVLVSYLVLKQAHVIWESGEEVNHYFLFQNKHSRCRRVYTAPAALAKTAQWSGSSTGKVAFNHWIFCQGVSSFTSFANEITNFKSFLLSTTCLFHYIFFILILGICTDTQIYSPHISCILANNFVLPTPFLITFLLTRQVID